MLVARVRTMEDGGDRRPCSKKTTSELSLRCKWRKRKRAEPQEPGCYPGPINGDNAAYSFHPFHRSPTFQIPSSILAKQSGPRVVAFVVASSCRLPQVDLGISRSPSSARAHRTSEKAGTRNTQHAQAKHAANPSLVSRLPCPVSRSAVRRSERKLTPDLAHRAPETCERKEFSERRRSRQRERERREPLLPIADRVKHQQARKAAAMCQVRAIFAFFFFPSLPSHLPSCSPTTHQEVYEKTEAISTITDTHARGTSSKSSTSPADTPAAV